MASVLSDADVQFLRDILRKVKHLPIASRGRRGHDLDELPAPETYVARIPTGGIPPIEGIEPQYEDCDIYRLVQSGGVKVLEKITGLTRAVYNLSTRNVDGDRWALVSRDKFGHWFVSGAVFGDEVDVGTGTDDITGTGTSTTTPTGTGLCVEIPGVDFNDLSIEEAPLYVLGVDSSGCLVRIAVGSC